MIDKPTTSDWYSRFTTTRGYDLWRIQHEARASKEQAMRIISLTICFILAAAVSLYTAVGCDLNDPDKKGGKELLQRIEQRLGDSFQGIFETIDVPYTLYQVYRKKDLIGYIHGVNQKGQYGGIQVFLALDLEGNIKAFYFQKLTSRHASKFRDHQFGEQFIGLNLKDFYSYDVRSGKITGPSRVENIKNPVPEAEIDFRASLRATKKNLILVDEFLLGNKYLKHFRTGGER
jgi:hypothetical protein